MREKETAETTERLDMVLALAAGLALMAIAIWGVAGFLLPTLTCGGPLSGYERVPRFNTYTGRPARPAVPGRATNAIEALNSQMRSTVHRVDSFTNGNQALRWAAVAGLSAEGCL